MHTYLQLIQNFQDPTSKMMSVIHEPQVRTDSILRAGSCKICKDPEKFSGMSLILSFRKNQSGSTTYVHK
jgi:hypothetical protein